MDTRVREATLNDVIGIVYVLATVWLDHFPNEEYEVTEADVRSVDFQSKIPEWQHMVQSPQYRVWVAAKGNDIVGFCAVHTEKVAEVYSLHVLPAEQRRGLGSQLLQEALRGLEPVPMRLNVAVYNRTAIEFYQKHGFRITSQVGAYEFPSGKRISTVEMRKNYSEEKTIANDDAAGYTSGYSSGAYAATPPDTNATPVGRTKLAKASGVRTSTIKYYTEIGLLTYTQESEGLKRYYDLEASLERLERIEELQAQGLSIAEIKRQLAGRQ